MWSQRVRVQTPMKHKVTEATLVTLQCVNTLIYSANTEILFIPTLVMNASLQINNYYITIFIILTLYLILRVEDNF